MSVCRRVFCPKVYCIDKKFPFFANSSLESSFRYFLLFRKERVFGSYRLLFRIFIQYLHRLCPLYGDRCRWWWSERVVNSRKSSTKQQIHCQTHSHNITATLSTANTLHDCKKFCCFCCAFSVSVYQSFYTFNT